MQRVAGRARRTRRSRRSGTRRRRRSPRRSQARASSSSWRVTLRAHARPPRSSARGSGLRRCSIRRSASTTSGRGAASPTRRSRCAGPRSSLASAPAISRSRRAAARAGSRSAPACTPPSRGSRRARRGTLALVSHLGVLRALEPGAHVVPGGLLRLARPPDLSAGGGRWLRRVGLGILDTAQEEWEAWLSRGSASGCCSGRRSGWRPRRSGAGSSRARGRPPPRPRPRPRRDERDPRRPAQRAARGRRGRPGAASSPSATCSPAAASRRS